MLNNLWSSAVVRFAVVLICFMVVIAGLIFTLANGTNSPPLSPTQAAAAEAKLDDYCGGRHWTNARWRSPMVDGKGRTRVRVTFDYSERNIDATIVLFGDRVHAIIINPNGDASGVNDWLRLEEQNQ